MALLVPTCVLFAKVWGRTSDDLSAAKREQHGVAYLQSLDKVTSALADAESAAVADRAVPRAALENAVQAGATTDDRFGAELRSHDRWAGLRAKLESLPDRTLGGAPATYTAYTEASDLLLALYQKVRDASGLSLDGDSVANYLQDGAARQTPQAVIMAGRYADLVLLASHGPASNASGQLYAARSAVATPAGDVTSDVQAAADVTASRSLGSNLLAQIDAFDRSVDDIAPSTSLLPGRTLTVSPAQVAKYRVALQTAALTLNAAVLSELGGILDSRVSDLGRQRVLPIAMLALALACAVVVAVPAARRRRRPEGPAEGPSDRRGSGRSGSGRPGGRRAAPDPGPPVDWDAVTGAGRPSGGYAGTPSDPTGRHRGEQGPWVEERYGVPQ